MPDRNIDDESLTRSNLNCCKTIKKKPIIFLRKNVQQAKEMKSVEESAKNNRKKKLNQNRKKKNIGALLPQLNSRFVTETKCLSFCKINCFAPVMSVWKHTTNRLNSQQNTVERKQNHFGRFYLCPSLKSIIHPDSVIIVLCKF